MDGESVLLEREQRRFEVDPSAYEEDVEVRAGEMRVERGLATIVAAAVKGLCEVFAQRVVALAGSRRARLAVRWGTSRTLRRSALEEDFQASHSKGIRRWLSLLVRIRRSADESLLGG